MSEAIRAAFRTQARFCTRSGSPFTGRLLEALAETLDETSRTGRQVLAWPGDPMVDALKLRLAGGLHALARTGRDPELSALYDRGEGDFEGTLARALRDHDDFLLPWLDGPPQTNEVARAGALWPGLLEVSQRFGPRITLLELGASAGLNLNMDRFAYQLGGARSGNPGSAVRIAPRWTGPPPPTAAIEIVGRAGVDLSPQDVRRPEVAERLIAYIWPDQRERIARAEAAIMIARRHPPPLVRGEGAAWLEAQLALPQPPGTTRVVYHSIALQYFPPEDRERVAAAMEGGGARATHERPLAWLSMEFPGTFVGGTALADIGLRCWPGGGARERLGTSHPHGAEINWNPASD